MLVLAVAALFVMLFALDHWKRGVIKTERQRRLDEGNPAPIDRLPPAVRGPVLFLVLAGAAALKFLLD